MGSWFGHTLSRDFTLRHFNAFLLIVATVWSTFVILLSLAAVGYEADQIASVQFNASELLWYERVFPKLGLFPKSWTCQGSLIKPADGTDRNGSADRRAYGLRNV